MKTALKAEICYLIVSIIIIVYSLSNIFLKNNNYAPIARHGVIVGVIGGASDSSSIMLNGINGALNSILLAIANFTVFFDKYGDYFRLILCTILAVFIIVDLKKSYGGKNNGI